MRFIFLMILFFLFPVTGQAQGIPNANGDEPLEITADESLEWHRDKKIFIATKNAKARQGSANIAADVLTAHYREDEGGDIEIWQITADDQVVLQSEETTAYGQKAIYDLDRGLATMTGNNLKLVSPDQTVTAKERFEYWMNDGRLTATGRARVTRLEDTLDADKVSATFTENAAGERVLHSLEAVGNVVITTATETVTGNYGIYRADTNVAELTGGVKITRGPNVLEGEKAQVDLNTNVSKMFGDPSGDGRVRGVFYPGSEEKPE